MKHKVLYFALLALSLALGGCLAEELVEVIPDVPEDVPIVGEYVSTNLTLDVGDVYVSSTRSEDPSDDPVSDNDAERHVDAIWVFQFDASSLAIVNGGAKLIEITDQTELQNLPTENVLVTNNGNPSIVYVVANVGSTSWVSVSTGFTLNDLLETTIPNPDPIYVDPKGNPASSIPMIGRTEGSVTVSSHVRIIVPIYRMFAKLMVKVGVEVAADNLEATPKTLDIGQVASTCTVGTLFTDDTTVPTYPEGTKFLPWTFSISSDYDPEDYFIIYVPENIQGETSNTEVGNKAEKAPANALMVTTHVDLNEIDENGNKVAIKPDPQYTVYPGGNVYNNFNIRRNCVYRISVSIQSSDVITPSANCLVATVGETFAFYPYVRDETGHTTDGYQGDDYFSAEYYDFDTHLAPGGDLEIKGLKIIWQTPGCIGDNSNYDLVYMRGSGMQTKIYVKTAQAGNALIAAYAEDGETILWSWHIWVTDNHPDDVSNAITYYHYSWDENGINTDTEVSGYPVMRCNLGALANFPSDAGGDYTQTYGMLYQWGRKDPFPPMKTTGGGEGGKFQGTYKYSNYTTTTNAEDASCIGTVVEIGVNDNSDVQIQLNSNTGLKGSGKDYAVFNTDYTSDIDATYLYPDKGITWSIHNPTHFIAPVEITFNYDNGDGSNSTSYYDRLDAYNNKGDWLPGGDDDLWGGNGKSSKRFQAYNLKDNGFEASIEDNYGEEKTIFDPCPYGWRVSPGDLWLGFTASGINYGAQHASNSDDNLWNGVNCANTTVESVQKDMGFTMYMQGWKGSLGGETSFFPTQGSRLANGQPYHGGICGNYHNATVDETVSVRYLNRQVGSSTYKVVDNDNGTLTQTDAIRRVDILHFHCSIYNEYIQVNTFEKELIYYNRAVAGPVRCVRDTKR